MHVCAHTCIGAKRLRQLSGAAMCVMPHCRVQWRQQPVTLRPFSTEAQRVRIAALAQVVGWPVSVRADALAAKHPLRCLNFVIAPFTRR